MSKLGYIFFLSIVLLILIAIASAVNAEDTFYTRYYEDFVEGEDLTVNLGVLDTLKFTYYNQNYSLRVLGVYSKSSTIRIEKRGFDINLDQTLSFNFDGIDDYDLEISLVALEDHTATFRLELNEKPSDEDDDDDEQINDTNSTDTSDSDDSSDDDDSSDITVMTIAMMTQQAVMIAQVQVTQADTLTLGAQAAECLIAAQPGGAALQAQILTKKKKSLEQT